MARKYEDWDYGWKIHSKDGITVDEVTEPKLHEVRIDQLLQYRKLVKELFDGYKMNEKLWHRGIPIDLKEMSIDAFLVLASISTDALNIEVKFKHSAGVNVAHVCGHTCHYGAGYIGSKYPEMEEAYYETVPCGGECLRKWYAKGIEEAK